MNRFFDTRLSRTAQSRLFGLGLLIILLVSSLFFVKGSGASEAETPAPLETAAPTASPAPEQLSVYIVGSVANPGVYNVEKGILLCDLIEMCGGLTDQDAALTVNMVYRIEKNCMITVGSDGGEVFPGSDLYPGETSEDGPVNINTASADLLCTLPGIGRATAEKILAYRDKHPFSSIDELMNVSGIGQSRFDAIKDLITVE